ncbi:GLPGLI family protein [Mucilaginibacter agri]|uniref:GLPGLI family protein n=1 Tax=Mucilaginibacter agri TaxID=2695265 RepID=A0A965ZFY2_9SPHI|nr:GLPGLI family protein [Mucilaginibacter agri]NCD69031.1 GLPGLI family protein [Mucilaginibacter agri]
MKSSTAILLALLTLFRTAIAQIPDTAKLVIQYQFIHVCDTMNRDKPYTENMMMLVGRNASVYKSLDRRRRLEMLQANLLKQGTAGAYFSNATTMSSNSTTEWFYYLNEHKTYRKEVVFNTYLIEESASSPVWRIAKDTLNIGGYNCQKASTHFKGREYVAWFCADLPFHAGPWKLNGLPGLILQAADSKNEVLFKFDGISPITASMLIPARKPAPMLTRTPGVSVTTIVQGIDYKNPEYIIMLPEKGIKTTEKELDRLKKLRETDPEEFVRASMIASGVPSPPDAMVQSLAKMHSDETSALKINNPIELSERKKK